MTTEQPIGVSIKIAYQLLQALRHQGGQYNSDLGSQTLALRILNHHDLAGRLEHLDSLVTEAQRRLSALEAASPVAEPSEDSIFASALAPDTPEMAEQRRYHDDYVSRWKEAQSEVSTVATALEARIDAIAPNYIAGRQLGDAVV